MTDTQFYIFEDRLVVRSNHTLEAKFGVILCVAFNAETTVAYFGTSRGYIISWDL